MKNGKALLWPIKGLNMEKICVVCSTCGVLAADIIHRMNHVTLRLRLKRSNVLTNKIVFLNIYFDE